MHMHLQTVSNECTNCLKNRCIHLLEHQCTKSCRRTGDRQTDRQGETNIPNPNFVCRGDGD